MAEKWIIGAKSSFQKNKFIEMVDSLDENTTWEFEWRPVKDTRTLQQNRAMRKYFMLMAEALNTAGLDFEQVLRVPVSWSPTLFKELCWDRVMESMTEKTSTAQLTTEEVSKVYDVLNRFFSGKFGLYVPFPDRHGG